MKSKKYSPAAHAREMLSRKWETATTHEHDVERIAFLVAGLRRAYAAGKRAGMHWSARPERRIKDDED